MAAKLVKASYVKESGERSDRQLVMDNSGNVLALDVTDLPLAEQTRMAEVYGQWTDARAKFTRDNFPSFADFAAGQGVTAAPYKSFKQSGLTIQP